MTYKLLGLLLFMSLFLVGCDSSDSGESTQSLIPLDEGNTWAFEVNSSSQNQAEIVLQGSQTISGESYRTAEATLTRSGFQITNTYAVRQVDGGLYIGRIDDGATTRLFGFELRTSVSPGGTYVHTDERGNTYDVSISEQAISVPAGTFDVRVYTATRRSNGGTDTAFISPGVGPVQLNYDGLTMRLVSTNVQ